MTPSSFLRLSVFAVLFVPSTSQGDTTTFASTVEMTTESIEVTTDSGCHDKEGYNCALMKNVCNVTAYQNILRENCPLTCYMCDDCYDKSTHCEAWNQQHLCTDPVFADVMAQDCQKTCHKCKGDSCYDESDRCAAWAANGLCAPDSPFKQEAECLCRKTCNYCDSAVVCPTSAAYFSNI